MDDRLSVVTPEGVAFSYSLAGIGTRFIALLIDTLLQGVLLIALSLGAGVLGMNLNRPGSPLDLSPVTPWLLAVFLLAIFLVLWGYFILFEALWRGQTPGKRLAGIRVVRIDGTPARFFDVLVRNLLRLIDFLPMFYGLGLVSMFVNRQSRRLGDLAAGTVVVREFLHAAPYLSIEETALVRDFMKRRRSLDPAHRWELAQRLMAAVLRRGGRIPADDRVPVDGQDAESFLEDWLRGGGAARRP